MSAQGHQPWFACSHIACCSDHGCLVRLLRSGHICCACKIMLPPSLLFLTPTHATAQPTPTRPAPALALVHIRAPGCLPHLPVAPARASSQHRTPLRPHPAHPALFYYIIYLSRVIPWHLCTLMAQARSSGTCTRWATTRPPLLMVHRSRPIVTTSPDAKRTTGSWPLLYRREGGGRKGGDAHRDMGMSASPTSAISSLLPRPATLPAPKHTSSQAVPPHLKLSTTPRAPLTRPRRCEMFLVSSTCAPAFSSSCTPQAAAQQDPQQQGVNGDAGAGGIPCRHTGMQPDTAQR